MTYTVAGKEVLLGGLHYADAIDETAARTIAYALNSVNIPAEPIAVPCLICKEVGSHDPNCENGRQGQTPCMKPQPDL